MSNQLTDKKVAILATDGFEEVELTDPRDALSTAGADTHLVSPNEGTIEVGRRMSGEIILMLIYHYLRLMPMIMMLSCYRVVYSIRISFA